MTAEENERAWQRAIAAQARADAQLCGMRRYIGADSEVVKWSDDDGSAAHEPDRNLSVNVLIDQLVSVLARNESLMAEIATIREFVSRLPEDDGSETASSGVQADIDRVCDHLFKGHTDDKQRAKLRTSVDRAERVRPGSDAAVGRALR